MILKKRIILLALSLVLSIPAVSFANNDFDRIQILKNDNGNLKMEEIPEETKLKVKELKEKLKTGEITKEQFHEEMKKLFPNKTQCNEEVPKKELPEETKAKLRELKTKLLNGEITEEQFQEEVDKVLPKRAIPKSIKPKED